MPRPKGTCIYCGRFDFLHMDHVPPQNIFEPHQRSNLVTVPCCAICNNSASKDDQYFFINIALRESAKQTEEHKRLWQKAVRTLKRQQASRFRQNLTSGIRFVQHSTPAGIILSPALSVPIDGLRVIGVVIRIVKGLYFHETKTRIPDTHQVIPYDELGLQNPPIERISEFAQIRILVNQLRTTSRKTISNVFAYYWASKPQEPATTMWHLDFFDGIGFFCVTRPTGNNLLASRSA